MDPNALKLLSALIEKTSKREIQWEKTSNTNEFKIQFKNGSALTVFKVPQQQGKEINLLDIFGKLEFNFRLYNQDGTVIETLNQLSELNDKKIVEQLFIVVDKANKKEDETYISIFKDLGI